MNNNEQQLTQILVNRKINIQMNKELHRLANDEARWERIDNKLKSLIESPKKKIKLIKYNKHDEGLKDTIYIVGDVHYRGEIDDKLVINTFSTIANDIKNKKYQAVELWLTGDNIDGEIHEEQQRTNEPIVDATIRLIDLYCKCISQIKQICKVRMVYGNHEEIRLWGDKNTENNIGKLIAHGLKHGLNIPVESGEELFFTYKGDNILLLHGHQGYAKNKAKLIEHCAVEYNCIPETIVLGHFHTSKTNQFSKNHWLITAPAVKDWASRWDKANGYCGLGQFVKLKLNLGSPAITTMNVEAKEC